MNENFFEINLSDWSLRIRAGDADYRHRYLWAGGRHSHGEYELHVVLSGKALLEVGKEQHLLTAGMAMVIAPGQYHAAKTEPGQIERFSMQILVPKGPLSERMQTEVSVCRVFPASEYLCRLCSEYYYETAAMNAYRREQQQSLLTLLLIGVFRELGVEQTDQKKESAISLLQRKIRIDTFFEKSLSTNVKLEELAARLHISPRQLSRFLTKHYGMSYRELLIRARMDQAAWLLRTTDQTIPRVAEQVGYKSESAFYKAFFKQNGVTPQQYRQNNKVGKEG
ncbi:MAG: helix-turn-helix domain-containing protein [Oscillospiraceae bacterium]|nr:helix-turn-helix domain-containing protein [Oscillospiraceae bacterium]